MKKSISVLLTILLLTAGLFVLTGCNKANENAGPTNGGINLKCDFTHQNNTVYFAHFDLASVQSISDFEEDSPETVIIENNQENYIVDLTLSIESKNSIEQQRNGAKMEENYTETKFGKYNGFYYKSDNEVVAYILLDTKDDMANAYILVDIYADNEDDENRSVLELFKSSDVQKLLNSVDYSSKKN